jgi:hypothetical protein
LERWTLAFKLTAAFLATGGISEEDNGLPRIAVEIVQRLDCV